MTEDIALTAKIKQGAIKSGYSACGVIAASAFSEYIEYLDKRINSFPGSEELYRPLFSLAVQPENAESIIVCIRGYNRYSIPESLKGMIGKCYMFDGRLSYSQESRAKSEFSEYLKILGIEIIQSGVPARWAAAKAGLVKFGRNNFVYTEKYGSYIWIDTWVTDKKLEYNVLSLPEDMLLPNCEDGCMKCVKACPTGALAESLSMDRERCAAHLTFYAEEAPDKDLLNQMGLWIYGCDDCQDACPANSDISAGKTDFPLLTEYVEYLKPERILEMDEETYTGIIYPRFWYAGEDGLWLWKCNALRVMINSREKKYHALIIKSINHKDERIRKVALIGIDILGIEQ